MSRTAASKGWPEMNAWLVAGPASVLAVTRAWSATWSRVAQIIARSGWSKADVRAYLAEHARRSVAELKRVGYLRGQPEPGDAQRFPALVNEDEVLVVAAGGSGGAFSAVVPPWAGGRSSSPVTRAVGACVDCE